MGALRLYSTRSTAGARGGVLMGLAKAGAKTGLRAIPGVGLATSAIGAGKALLPKKPGFGTGLVTGMASGPASKAAAATAKAVVKRATAAVTGRKKYRRMNPANWKALTRAVKRIQRAEEMFRKVLSVQGKKATGIKPKRRK